MTVMPWLNGLRKRLKATSSRRASDRSRGQSGDVSRQFEKLEDRTLLAASVQFSSGLLRILVDSDESIVIGEDPDNAGEVDVQIDGVSTENLPEGLTTAEITSLDIIAGSGENTIDLSAVDSMLYSSLTGVSVDAGQGNDTLIAPPDIAATLSGGHGEDTLTGSSAADVLNGDDGDDSIVGGDGNDTIDGGDGDDEIIDDMGDDSVLGGDGEDTITTGVGNDFVSAGDGNDSVLGGDGDDSLNGMMGDDTLDGGAGNDSLQGGSNVDSLLGGAGMDTLLGNAGDDILDGGDDADRLMGQNGHDSINGGGGADFINGANGTDTLNGNAGEDTILGGRHGDAIQGGDDDDTLRGQGGPDTVLGNAGQDFIDGGTGNDGLAAADPFVSIATSASAMEGDPGSPNSAVITLTLSAPTLLPATVDFTAIAGSAGVGTDFVDTTGTATFAAGQLTQTISIPLVADLTLEPAPDETFQVVLSNGQGVQIANGTSTVSIVDDDVPAFSINDITVNEGGDAGDIIFALDLSGSAGNSVPGATVGDVNGDGTSNTVIDVELAALIDFNNTILAADVPMARVSIIVFFSTFSSVGRVEMDPANTTYQLFTMNLSTSPIADVDMNGVNDVEDILRSITPPPQSSGIGSILGTANQTFQDLGTGFGEGLVLVLSDFGIGSASPTELANLTVTQGHRVRAFAVGPFASTSTAASYDPNFAQVTQPTDLANELSNVNVASSTPFFVTLDEPATVTTTVDFATMDGTAIAGVDYVPTSGTLTFPPGSTQQNVVVQVFGDDLIEMNEDFSVVLSNPTGDTRIEDGIGIATVIDNGMGTMMPPLSASASFIPPLAAGSRPRGPVVCETVLGGPGRDTLFGSELADFMDGDAGNDLLIANSGNDTLLGGSGQDTLLGEGGDDTLNGQGGADIIEGGAGSDIIEWMGSPDNDDTVRGDDGNDEVLVEDTDVGRTYTIGQTSTGELMVTQDAAMLVIDETVELLTVNGNNGDDTITITDIRQVSRTVIIIDGGVGDDTLDISLSRIGSNIVKLRGGVGQDTIFGSDAAEEISGGEDDDSIVGGEGDDTIDGGAGADVIDGGFGNDLLLGGADDDTIDGGEGNDTIDGGLDSDALSGGFGDDSIRGNFGDDNLNGNAGADSLDGGSGQDTLSGGSGGDLLDGGRNNDRINGQGGNDSIIGDHGDDSIDGGSGQDEILGGDGNDTIDGGSGNDGIDGGDGNDLLHGRNGRDVLVGGDGNDTLRGGGSADTLLGDQGIDVLNGNGGSDLGQLGQGLDPAPVRVEIIDEEFVLTAALLARLDAM